MKKETLTEFICALLILLFVYTAFSKWFDFAGFWRAMHNQPIPGWSAAVLAVIVPPMELCCAVLLMTGKTRIWGLRGTAGLMTVFTLYIVLILSGAFHYIPCSCGGVIREFSWKQHLLFNILYLTLSIIGLLLERKNPPGKLKHSRQLGSKIFHARNQVES
jgi:hypothetical protein